MTELKNLLDQAAGREPIVTDTQVASDLGRAQRAARRRRIGGIGVTAGVAAVAIAALAVPLVLSGGADAGVAAPPSADAPATAVSASDVLLAAAAKEEKVEATTGKYFRVRTVYSGEWTVKGDGTLTCCGSQPAGPGGYKLRELRVIERWTGLKGGTSWTGTRSLGAQPATAADVAAWKRAGAPTSWNAGPSDTVDKRAIILSTKPDKGSLMELKDGADRYPALGLQATLQDVLALPTTQAALRKELLEVKAASAADASEVSALAQISSAVLSDTPALPKTRAATFRLLAELKGAKVTPNVSDVVGRKGTAVEFAFPAYQLNLRLIIDPASGKLLSSGRTGGKNGDTTVLLSGWTDETPQVPPASVK